jgi:hypothetical protein
VSERCENCETPAIYSVEGELGKVCYCTAMLLLEDKMSDPSDKLDTPEE